MASNLPRYTLRTDAEILYKINYIAGHNGRSANKEIEQLIKQHIANFESEHGPIPVEEG